MTALTLEQYREKANVSQSVMAEAMGIPLRTYEDIASGKAKYRPIHVSAAIYASIKLAVQKQDGNIMPAGVADLVKAASELLT